MKKRIKQYLLAILLSPTILLAHQPVMDMAPRWEGGYGFQTRLESFSSNQLKQGTTEVSNPLGLRNEKTTLWLEGVYSFTREHRVSFKLPYTNHFKRVGDGGSTQDLRNEGMGDVIVGFLNKFYVNKKDYTGNISITPSLRLPTGATGGDISIGDGVVDFGLSVSASVESYGFYGMVDFFGWANSIESDGSRNGNSLGLDIDMGIHPYHDMKTNSGVFALMGLNSRIYSKSLNPGGFENQNSGSASIEMVPTLIWYKDNIMVRGQYHMPIYSDMNGSQLQPTSGIQFGVGIVFES
ncbi:transporter [bacterium]|jgi:hypothetical protein|nr:transporter [bacterium]